jgi:O-antigen/teichoic acid export membrane protein
MSGTAINLKSRLMKNTSHSTGNREVIVASAISFSVRIVAAFAGFIVSYFVAKKLGIEDSGYYFLAFSVVTLLAAISKVGLDNTVLRFIGANQGEVEDSIVSSLIKKSMLLSLSCSAIIGCILFLFSEYIAINIFNKPQLAGVLQFMAPAIVAIAFSSLIAMFLQGMKRVISSVFILNIATNLLLVACLFLFSLESAINTAIAFSSVSFITLIIAIILLKGRLDKGTGEIKWNTLLQSCLPLWWVVTMNQLVLWAGQIFTGIWEDGSVVAQFAIAQRIAMLTSFVLIAVNMVVAPRFAAMYKANKMEELQHLAVISVKIMTAVALPIVLIMLIFPSYLMGIFGDGFTEGTVYLQVLAVGQFVNVVTGSVGYLLSMSGHEKDLRNTTLFSGILVLFLCLTLVPVLGALGAAIATSIAVATQNLVAVFWVKKRLGFNTLRVW